MWDDRRSMSPCARLAPVLLLFAACGAEEPPQDAPAPPPVDDPDPPTARWEDARRLAADRDAPRHPADGGGTVRLELGEGRRAAVEVMAPATWTLVYTAGPEGVAPGGSIHFWPDPFWGWSSPQTRSEEHPGYTEVTTPAEGVDLELRELTAGAGQTGALIATVRGRGLQEGDEVRIVYGAGRLQAFADRFAERGARLWILVDGDGDGVRAPLAESPTVDVLPGPAARLVLHGPSVAREGESVRFTAAVLDVMGNVAEDASGTLRVRQRPEGWGLPETIELFPEQRGVVTFSGTASGRGIARVAVELDGLELPRAEANPLVVGADVPRIRWGDLHGHSNLSDGTGLPEDWWRYARDVAALDVAALTDHDHWGVRFIDRNPDLWARLTALAAAMNEPGRFVALPAYEWTSWIHGHRHVLYFADEGPLFSSLDPRYEDPRRLWNALAGLPALTFAHHSAGDPVATNWSFRPPEDIEPVTEVMSVHGSSEAADSPRLVRGARRGNYVRDQLDRGYRLGFVGSGDGHDGHPGLAHLSPMYGWRRARPGESTPHAGTGGLAAILCEELTREAVLDALKARRCYATSGPRIVIDARLGPHPIGTAVDVDALEEPVLDLLVVATAGLEWIDLVRPEGIDRLELAGERRLQVRLPVGDLTAGGYLYVRLRQQDGALAWTSPWFLE